MTAPIKKLRYPFKKGSLPEFVEVPFDVSDVEAGTFEVKINSLPTEKFKTLNYQLSTATSSYLLVKAELEAGEALARGEGRGPLDEELAAAVGVIRESEEIKPQLKRLLTEYILGLSRQRRDNENGGPLVESFLSNLQKIAPMGGDVGYSTLAFAQALADSDGAIAAQRVSESFENRLSESLAGMSRAREKIVAFGIASHKGLVGCLVDEVTGEPLVDEEGAQIEKELPFTGGRWVWNGKEKRGVASEGLDFYRSLSPNGGLMVSLSEAVLIYQTGAAPTVDEIYARVGKKRAPSPSTPTPDDLAKALDDRPQLPTETLDKIDEGKRKQHPDDDEVAPLT